MVRQPMLGPSRSIIASLSSVPLVNTSPLTPNSAAIASISSKPRDMVGSPDTLGCQRSTYGNTERAMRSNSLNGMCGPATVVPSLNWMHIRQRRLQNLVVSMLAHFGGGTRPSKGSSVRLAEVIAGGTVYPAADGPQAVALPTRPSDRGF